MVDFHRLITEWYRLNKRSLPWRDTKTPYLIWLSEIILQQTRVIQGIGYYNKFVNHYPTVFDLANATEKEVLNDWQGLGYYSRARNLHATAKVIAFELNGVFPSTFEDIKKLKGVGDYTAAAIASFAFDLPYSVVDGNVYRVLSRVFNIDLAIDSTAGKKYFAELAQELLSENNPAIHNQAIMEMGAVQCLPVNPLCDSCVLSVMCAAKELKLIYERPVKEKRTKVRDRFFHFMICKEGDQLVFEQRTQKDIWQNMYQFPLIETEDLKSFNEMKSIFKRNFGIVPVNFSKNVIHILSHQKINAIFYHFDQIPDKLYVNRIKIKIKDIQEYPIPRLIDRYLESNVL